MKHYQYTCDFTLSAEDAVQGTKILEEALSHIDHTKIQWGIKIYRSSEGEMGIIMVRSSASKVIE